MSANLETQQWPQDWKKSVFIAIPKKGNAKECSNYRTIEDGPVDRYVRGFHIARESRAPIAAVSAACHGVFRGRVTAVSADFAGEVCRLLICRSGSNN